MPDIARTARSFLNRLDAGYDCGAVFREMTAVEFEEILRTVANGESKTWSHVVTGPDLYFCPACRKVSNVPLFCTCFPDRVRTLPLALAQKP